MEKLRAFFSEYSDELLHKVQWPSWEELQNQTVTVLIASVIIAVVIFLMDFSFSKIMGALYALF